MDIIAIQLTEHNLGAGLYAPLRVLIYENERLNTCVEYDKPSSLLGQFNNDRIASAASLLDNKMEAMVTAAVE